MIGGLIRGVSERMFMKSGGEILVPVTYGVLPYSFVTIHTVQVPSHILFFRTTFYLGGMMSVRKSA